MSDNELKLPDPPSLRVKLELFGADNDFVFFQGMVEKLLANANGVEWSLSNDAQLAHRTLELFGDVGTVARILESIPKFYPPGTTARHECEGTTYIFREYDGANRTIVTHRKPNHKDCGYEPPPSPPPLPQVGQHDRREHG